MYLDVVDLRNFYGEPLGRMVRFLLAARLRRMWPKVAGDRIVGLGHATPFLRSFREEAERVNPSATIASFFVEGAIEAIWAGDSATHNRLVAEAIRIHDTNVLKR